MENEAAIRTVAAEEAAQVFDKNIGAMVVNILEQIVGISPRVDIDEERADAALAAIVAHYEAGA